MQLLRTARDYHQPPSGWLGGDGSWTKRDRITTLALTVYEDGLCKTCGRPLAECRDPKNDGYYEAKTATCYYQQGTEAWLMEQRRGKKNYQPQPGQLIYAELNHATPTGDSVPGVALDVPDDQQ